jgi:hypothetical protein
VAGRNRPSFLKKQKEEQRRTRATRKREERRARKQAANLNDQNPTALEETLEEAPESTSEDETREEL